MNLKAWLLHTPPSPKAENRTKTGIFYDAIVSTNIL